MKPLVIHNALVINENIQFKGSLLIRDGKIENIWKGEVPVNMLNNSKVIEAGGFCLLPGVIDDQVHFREPGLTHKGDIYTEAKAAIAGGVTSFMEMPNTIPHSTTMELLEEKYAIAAEKSLANYSFYIGATNDNISELLKTDPAKVCGIKIFMGSSTGNMLVDNMYSLTRIFAECPMLIATHCEDEAIILKNTSDFKKKYGDDIPISMHPRIRSEEACFKSSSLAAKLAQKYNSRLHILHLSTAKEMELFSNALLAKEKKITSEVCVQHLWFDEKDYPKHGSRIKWNPAIKTENDKDALFKALLNGKIDVVATDHAPHNLNEKQNPYFKTPSGGPLVQHSLVAMLEFFHQGRISLEKIVEKMCHTPADIFKINKRGYIREGYHADLVLVDLNNKWTVNQDNILYKCKWSPFEGQSFNSKVIHTFVNGNLVYEKDNFNEQVKGKRLIFEK